MTSYRFRNFSPEIGERVFIADSADIIGNVKLHDDANIWFGVVIRGDVDSVTIGEKSNIQDLSMLHVAHETPLIIGKHVTVGHKVTLHGCTIGDGCLIGMDSVVLDKVVVGNGSVVAAGSVLPPGKRYPENSLIMGSPAKVVRALTEEEKKQYSNHYSVYLKLAEEYRTASFQKID